MKDRTTLDRLMRGRRSVEAALVDFIDCHGVEELRNTGVVVGHVGVGGDEGMEVGGQLVGVV